MKFLVTFWNSLAPVIVFKTLTSGDSGKVLTKKGELYLQEHLEKNSKMIKL